MFRNNTEVSTENPASLIQQTMEHETPVANTGTSQEIKSSAVVKYSSVKFPVQFSTIRLNTDLNYPPSDRLQAGFYMFQDQHMRSNASHFSQFLSVNMANTYQDYVGKVDVISSSKNIKALLKMPYSKSPTVSIIVHRLRKTLLLEEFDVHKHLLKKEAEEWNWLRSYFNNVISKGQEDKTKCIVSANTRRDSFTVAEKMYMNLIRHSFAASREISQCTALETAESKPKHVEPVLESSEDLKGFHHENLWKFEDISMLIDSDLPIFGSGETRRPCISLKLRDARSPPINVLTGLDYWLDNLMSNVPEVAMCYHVNGFVQKYEVMRTEDIPNLENSSFDPNEVLDIAQNLMSFIKRQAAVEGHTYWLYKNENDDMVKLYDLTDYCKNEISEGDNPFTVPVGLLCHRVGRNLIRTNQRRTADARAMFENCLRLLDENKHAQVCAEAHFHLSDLWVPDKSVNDVWQEKGKISDPPSDLYDEDETGLDDSTGLEQPAKETESTQEACKNLKSLKLEEEKVTSEKNPEKEETSNAVALKELFVRGMVKRKAWNVIQACCIAGTTDERCRMALTHIRKGLNCVDKDQSRGKNIGLVETQRTCSPSKAIPLHYTPLNKRPVDKDERVNDQDAPQICSPFTPIPLHYSSLRKEKEALSGGEVSFDSECDDNAKTSSLNHSGKSGSSSSCSTNEGGSSFTSNEEDHTSHSWHVEAKFQLLKKAAVTYFVLAKEFFEIKMYGHTLRHLRYAMHCYEAVELLNKSVREESQDKELYLMMLYLAAKARLSIHSNWLPSHKDFEELGEEEAAILHSAQSVLSTPKNSWVYEWPNSQESNLLAANELYQQAFKLPILDKKPQSFKLLMKKNYAACVMTLGYNQMEICRDRVCRKENFETIRPMWNNSLINCQKAIKMFEGVGDRNTAGHNCVNVAYLYVLAAAAIHNDSVTSELFPPAEKEYLAKVVEWYEKGLSKYDKSEKMEDYRETIYHHIRIHYQQMAQRYFTLPTGKITEQDLRCMKELLQKSLSYCFTDSSKKNIKSSQITAANNHLNLARVFDVEAASCTNPSRKKNLRQKMEENFQNSFNIYNQIKWRRSQMCCKYLWIVSLLDESETKSLSPQARKKLIRNIFVHLCDLHPVLVAIKEGNSDPQDNTTVHSTNVSAVKQLLSTFNAACCSFLKIDLSNSGIKQLYQRSLRLTTLTELDDLLLPLTSIMNDLKTLLATDLVHH